MAKSIMIVALVHTFGAELARHFMRVPGAIRPGMEKMQNAAFMGALGIPLLMRSELGYDAPFWLVTMLLLAALAVSGWFAQKRAYWLLTAIAAIGDLALAASGELVIAAFAVAIQLMIAGVLRRRKQ